MHDAEGPGSQEPGPSASSAQVEVLRRQLYSRSPAPGAVRDYLGAAAALQDVRGDERDVAVPEPAPGPADVAEEAARPIRPRSPHGRLVVIGMAVAAVALAATLWWTAGSAAPLPERIAPPAAPGRTLLYYSRAENPESAPDKVTFEPASDRMLFHADGRRLVVVLRCVGKGTVRITAAEQRFEFRCDDRMRTFSRRSRSAVRGPFFILGRTTGDVVWGMRLTSVPDVSAPTGSS